MRVPREEVSMSVPAVFLQNSQESDNSLLYFGEFFGLSYQQLKGRLFMLGTRSLVR